MGRLRASAQDDGLEATAKARQTFRDSFLAQIPSDLPEAQRARRAEAARRLHYARMAFASSQRTMKAVSTRPIAEISPPPDWLIRAVQELA
jgi:hypothetical protein